MLKQEIRECENCHRLYKWSGGGIVMRIDIFDNLCPECKEEKKKWWNSITEDQKKLWRKTKKKY